MGVFQNPLLDEDIYPPGPGLSDGYALNLLTKGRAEEFWTMAWPL